eukprot:TRINITY_DN15866_c0_g2_i1.p1 TRINITY_DN15866_c0_g2~~TRINITY_DN15866_c0_g2_i1.p1  ORF type:complete len:271 (+),score=43.03 TRINITY_DN15866_c0_g2_i1:169-981(+)
MKTTNNLALEQILKESEEPVTERSYYTPRPKEISLTSPSPLEPRESLMKFLLEDKEGEGIVISSRLKDDNNLKANCNSRNRVHKALPSPNVGHPTITSARTSIPQTNPVNEKWSEALIPRLKTRTRFLTSLKPAKHSLPSEMPAEKPQTQEGNKLKKSWTCESKIKYDFKNMKWYDCRPRLIINRYYRKNFTLNCIQKPTGNFILSSVSKNFTEKLSRDQADMNLYRTTFNVRRVKPLAERLTETNPKQKAYIVEDWFNKGNIDPQLLYE